MDKCYNIRAVGAVGLIVGGGRLMDGLGPLASRDPGTLERHPNPILRALRTT